jgi:DNA-binding protein WhiA
MGVTAQARMTRNRLEVRVVGSEQGSALLERLGARESAKIYLAMHARQQVEQLERANSARAQEAAARSCARVRWALDTLDGRPVPAHWLTTGQLRLAYPNASLSELAELSEENISGDVIAGRIRRLTRLAEKSRQEVTRPMRSTPLSG